MATIPQRKRLLQTNITEEAFRRIKVAAARTDRKPGEVISDLAMLHLPPADPTTEQLKKRSAA